MTLEEKKGLDSRFLWAVLANLHQDKKGKKRMILQFIQAACYRSQNMLKLTNFKWSTHYNIKCFGIVVFYGQLFV